MNTVGPAGSIELPIFDQGQARIAAAQAELEREQALYQSALQQATLQIRQAFAACDFRHAQAVYLESQTLPLAQTALKLKRAAFDTGDANSLEMLTAQANLLDTQLSLASARYEADIARIALTQSTGWSIPRNK